MADGLVVLRVEARTRRSRSARGRARPSPPRACGRRARSPWPTPRRRLRGLWSSALRGRRAGQQRGDELRRGVLDGVELLLTRALLEVLEVGREPQVAAAFASASAGVWLSRCEPRTAGLLLRRSWPPGAPRSATRVLGCPDSSSGACLRVVITAAFLPNGRLWPNHRLDRSMAKTALITGITGQDGSYLAELLLGKGYEVHGVVRRSSTHEPRPHRPPSARQPDPSRGLAIRPPLRRHDRLGRPEPAGQDSAARRDLQPRRAEPRRTSRSTSPSTPATPTDSARPGCSRPSGRLGLPTRFYQASTSEMFGLSPPPQSETTPFHPRSPYAVAKLYAHWMTVNYREAHHLFACSGILFNHESPRRGENFVTRKVTRGIGADPGGQDGQASAGQPRRQARLGPRARLRRGDVADAAAGRAGRLRDRDRRHAFGAGFRRGRLRGWSGLDWEKYVVSRRGVHAAGRRARAARRRSKAAEKLGWKPTTTFDELVREMLENDMKLEGVDPAKHLVGLAETPLPTVVGRSGGDVRSRAGGARPRPPPSGRSPRAQPRAGARPSGCRPCASVR